MKRSLLILVIFSVVLLSDFNVHAQVNDNIWFDGLSRSYFVRDAIDKSTINDTLSPNNRSNGYNLLDLNTHVNPIKDIEIMAQLRIRIPLEVFWFRNRNKCSTAKSKRSNK